MKKEPDKKLSKSKEMLLSMITIAIPFIVLIIIELMLRLFGYGHNLNLFINLPNKNYAAYRSVNPDIGEKYFQKFEATGGTNDIFLKNKPGNDYRIFILGSSSVVGFPYSYNLMFSRILQKRLQDSYPDKHIEVINTAITAINSFTLLDFMKEIVHYKPDAIIIYAGHNEFYGAFGIGSQEKLSRNKGILNLHFKLLHLRIYQLVRNIIYDVVNAFSKAEPSADKGTLMKRMVADAKITYKSEKYKTGIKQFNENFSDILNIAENHKIPVFIGNLISNIRDLKPFGSIKTDSFPAAIDIYNQALKEDSNQNYEKAKQLFSRAKDLDCVRFRASEEVNDSISKLASRYNACLVPVKSYFEKNSPNGLIGNNLICEHLHPNIEGYFLIAEAFYNAIVKSKLIDSKTDTFNYHSAGYFKKNWGYTELDSLAGMHKVNRLKSEWPFVPENKEYDYKKNYHPQSIIDSMAFSTILYVDITVEGQHQKLAEKYITVKDYYHAYREYESLICINPYRSEYYIEAGNCLLNLSDLHSAFQAFKKSLEFGSKNYFPYIALGDINILRNDYSGAITYYQKALSLADNQKVKQTILSKLYSAYAYNAQDHLSKMIFRELLKLNPAANPNIPKLTTSYSNFTPYFIQDELNKARNLMKDNKYDAALDILLKSLDIWDTPITNKYIGDILYSKQNNSLLYYYNKAYPEFYANPDFLCRFCMAYLVNKQVQNASTILTNLKSISPHYPYINNLEKLIKKLTTH